jgi:hypothetical protein
VHWHPRRPLVQAGAHGSFEGQLKHKYKRKADNVMQCDVSDHALAAIIIKAPGEEDERRPLSAPPASRRGVVISTARVIGLPRRVPHATAAAKHVGQGHRNLERIALLPVNL